MLKWLGNLVDSNEKQVKKLQKQVEEINSLEPGFQKLTDEELKAKTAEFRARLQDGETLDDILCEAFAAVREASRRTLGQRHYDVQLMGGMVLHQGKIAEMKTGEGKTLVATLPLYLNCLSGKGSHLVTVNDYLARRDAHWMGPVYHALGVTVASIYPQQNPDDFLPACIYDPDPAREPFDKRWPAFRKINRQEAYRADITYGTNNEFGFDYLRDNMVLDLSQCVQRTLTPLNEAISDEGVQKTRKPLSYAIVDEVDNILIDEARTPLIISGQAEEANEKYAIFARSVLNLKEEEDYQIDQKTRGATLTDGGITKMEKILHAEGVMKAHSLYDPANYALTQYMENALKAYAIFKRDRDYVVRDGQVLIVDEFTGRLMFGRRYSEGLHQAIEAKEKVKIQRESVTLATITFQNYFRLYEKLAGMTGTAVTEAEEFFKIYKLEVVAIPTNREMKRNDLPDQIYKDEDAKFKAVAKEIETLHKQGRPTLIGTVSIEKSEKLSELLKRRGIPHQILNAKNNAKEADIIAQAGRTGSVTVSTNMAGRGVDIILGGAPPLPDEEGKLDEKALNQWQVDHGGVIDLGGLFVIGTERHEARRVDNQLRGRAGRQGDPGSTRFYVSLEDDIVKRFGGERIKGFMEWAGMDENTPIENSMVSKAIENAQVRTEGYHFDIRKHLVDYDDIINKHRDIIYTERRKILSGADLKANILDMVGKEIEYIVHSRLEHESGYDAQGLIEDVSSIMPMPPDLDRDKIENSRPEDIRDKLTGYAAEVYENREKEIGSNDMRIVERLVMLKVIDDLWKQHLTAMDHLRESVGLQAMRQVDPLVIYKKEGHALFEALTDSIQHDLVHSIFKISISREKAPQRQAPKPPPQPAQQGKRVGRNDPCPCGSGKKYKHCCGK